MWLAYSQIHLEEKGYKSQDSFKKEQWVHGLDDNTNANTTQNDLQIQHSLYQNPNDVFGRNREIHLKIHMESQG